MDQLVTSISDFISAVKEIIEQTEIDHSIVVFRGESIGYDTPCQPNVFRTKLSQTDKFFEKNLFDEMSANHLTNGQTYLEMAIDAQHGGFPSRLLDVTYNCLVALYFAVTPYYTKDECSHDDEDGWVYVFFLEDLYCPTGNNINQAYKACINHDEHWFSGQEIFQKNHKLIDHIKKNPRIIAQQGAFLLFQGERLSSFPCYRYKAIKIDKDAKPQLRKDLCLYFGIHTGSIYPEEFNLVNEMIRKSEQVSSAPFSLQGELNLVFHNIEKMIEHYLNKLEVVQGNMYQKIIDEIEEELFDYHMRLEAFLVSKAVSDGEFQSQIDVHQVKNRFNKLIQEFACQAEDLMKEDPDCAMRISQEELLL